ncbi:NAD(P)H-hydrate dehydratase [Thalassomonas sp. M1454]|uniref:NAD(P)H-hydrate dehydratase n=1 Tax=Thalassomonas sp. M1454 TaxID=2594477 RepID=UPI001181194D|nr:NAD(P)H-hydrate dehydratase [Thalassomonas sp. M1454]TRX57883.1 NAD(P)H-hydrate dehydratase [Thalassomonas sp. M1454]
MLPIKLQASIPQHAYHAELVKNNEGKIAEQKGITLYQLMESAGLAAFELFKQQWPQAKTVLVVCGRGNNAGDGFVFARLAKAAGLTVYLHALASFDDYQGDAALASEKYLKIAGEFSSLDNIAKEKIDVVIDAILGTGIKGALKPNYRELIEFVNVLNKPVLSIDLPSGLNANTGQVSDACIKAKLSVCFIALKQGMLTGEAKNYCGDIYIAGLGIADEFANQVPSNILINHRSNLPQLTKRLAAGHKGNSGFVLALAGNKGMPGAARLCTEAALRSGAGLLALACHVENKSIVVSNRPEIMLVDIDNNEKSEQQKIAKANVIVIGPGLGTDNWAQRHFDFALAQQKRLIVDADGLNLLAKKPRFNENWVLTPHPGEAARLLGVSVAEVENDRFAAVQAIALKYGGIVVLKGAGTLICDGKRVAINFSGNPGMASGGMGDVLSGILAALSLQLDDLFYATCQGVDIHSQAADIAAKEGEKGLLASDLFPYIRQLVNL